jgi:hypothetical protein
VTLSRSLLADSFRLMALDHRAPRQSDLVLPRHLMVSLSVGPVGPRPDNLSTQ